MTTKRVRTIAKLRELSLVPAAGPRAQVTYYPSKRDQQFIFDARTGAPGQYTANNLLQILTEEKVSEEMLHDVYVDFEIAQWGYSDGPDLTGRNRPRDIIRKEPVREGSSLIHNTDLTHEEADLEELEEYQS